MNKPIRVLIIEDCEDDAALLVRELRRGGYDPIFECVSAPETLAAALEQHPWDIVICDYSMPRFNGLAALKTVTESGLDIPFLLVSGTVGEETAVAAMKAGASDYLLKGHLARLIPVIERELREFEIRRQRKQAQISLQESEARFRSLSASSPIGVFQTDARGQMLYSNERCQAILGLAPEESPGDGWIQAIHPEDRAAMLAGWAAVVQAPRELSHEYRLLSPTGAIRSVRERAAILRSQNGEVAGFVGTLEDITESKQAQAQILRQFERLTALRAIDVAILGNLDLRVALNIIYDQVLVLLHVHAVNCLLLNPLTGMLEYCGGRGFTQPGPSRPPLQLGDGYAGQAVLDGRSVYIPDLREAPADKVCADLVASERFVAYYAIPLIANGEALGVLELYHRESLASEPDWLEYLNTLAGQAAIAIFHTALIENIRSSHAALTIAYDATLEGWVKALDLRDHETEGHTQRVTQMTLRLARAMAISQDDLAHIRRGALLHDIGKIAIPDHILLKPGKLTDEEWVLMRKHPVYAYHWLAPIAYLGPCLDIPYCHHEKWDGSGYPRGLAAEAIPLAARVFAIVDVWDALCSDRPYRKAWRPDQVIAHVQSLAGTHFDPGIVKAFQLLLAEDAAISGAGQFLKRA